MSRYEICKCGHERDRHSKTEWGCMACHVCGSFRLDEEHPTNKSLNAMEDYDRQRDFLASGKAELALEKIRIMEKPFDDFQFKWEMKVSIAEHETMLAFNSDWQSLAFEDWLSIEGMYLFAKWLKENKEKYEE